MQDLLNCTGLSKSSLYDSFGNKRALFERCLDLYRARWLTMMSERMAAAPNALTFIREMLESVEHECKRGSPRGCLIMNTAGEWSQKDPAIARRVRDSINAFSAVFRTAVRQAQAEGDIPADKDPAEMARFIVANMSGLRTLAKAGAGPKTLRTSALIATRALQH